DASLDTGVDAGRPTSDKVDLLLMVDNSRSMLEEQASLAMAFPELIRALSLGDSNGDGEPDFTPLTDMHVGVVTSDMGTAGFTVPTCDVSVGGDDGIMRTTYGGPSCVTGDPPFLTFNGTGISGFGTDFACVAGVGTDGCGLEQQLEAALKALTPSSSGVFFVGDGPGHGDRENAGFLRDDSVLVVLVVTDEEDCSVAVPQFFSSTTGPYRGVGANIRCTQDWTEAGAPDPLQPIARYADGFRALKPGRPDRVVFAALVGIPTDLEGSSFGNILSDARMAYRPDSSMPNQLIPSCDVAGRGTAYPPRRIVETAQELDITGSTGLVRSICQEDYSGLVDALLTALAPLLTPA
ncbi:MAG: hypothetical protein GXP55_05885, partial [Deltaproteobacteria bacterium]|nr:hypothetical protein [Deltaproteobacteria bacterium]